MEKEQRKKPHIKKYISHFSAAYEWDIPYFSHVLNANYLKKRLDTNDIEITVSTKRERYRRKGYIVHLCELELPPGAVINRNGILIASPELVFLQLANILDIHRLILLGLLMCSHNVSNPKKAITTNRKLKAFISKTSGHRGHRKAVRAIKYIEDGAASIIEAIMFMLIRLPHLLGGYGLRDFKLNHEVRLDKEGIARLKQKRCFVDFYNSQENLGIEYDSLKHHGEPRQQSNDLMRTTTLGRLGIKIFRCGTYQLYEKDAFNEFILNIASEIKKRIRIRTSKFKKIQKYLRQLLPIKDKTPAFSY